MLIIVIIMNMNVKLTGINEKIILGAISAGLAKTKTGAITLGLVELEHKYNLLERMEGEEDLREARRIMAEIKSGRAKLYTRAQFEKKAGMKIR